MKQESDKELILGYLKGNEKNFEILTRRHLNAVYRFAFYFLNGRADEAPQEKTAVIPRL